MSNEGQHLDMATLSELKELMADEYVVLLETYLNDAAGNLDSIEAAVTQGSAVELRESAHNFRGSSSNIGAVRLATLSGDIEQKAIANQLSGVDLLLTDMLDEYKIVQQLLQDELSNLH